MRGRGRMDAAGSVCGGPERGSHEGGRSEGNPSLSARIEQGRMRGFETASSLQGHNKYQIYKVFTGGFCTERCPRGRRGTTGNRMYSNVPRVRIPLSPPLNQQRGRRGFETARTPSGCEGQAAWMRPEVRVAGLSEGATRADEAKGKGRRESLSVPLNRQRARSI